MKTELDAYIYQKWYLESFTYKDSVLILDLGRLQIQGDHDISPRFIISFGDVLYFQVYDEINHIPKELENRDDGVIGQHSSSMLLEYLSSNSQIIDNTPGECKHFSVMTGDEFVHVITRSEPTITKIV